MTIMARGKQTPSVDPQREPLRALNRNQARILEAIAGRILPLTETPGAIEAGAVDYIDLALSDVHRSMLPRYQRGLRGIDRYARRTFGKPFATLSAADADTVLGDLEAGRVSEIRNGAEFFQLLRRHVLEGVFGEPSYGGNRNLAGWQLVGFPGQRFGYVDPYINRPVDLPPTTWRGPDGEE